MREAIYDVEGLVASDFSTSTRVVLGSILFINVSDSENSSPVSNPTPVPRRLHMRTTIELLHRHGDKGLLILPNIVLFAFITLTWVRSVRLVGLGHRESFMFQSQVVKILIFKITLVNKL